MESGKMLPIQRVTKDGKQATHDLVAKELPLTIILDGRELANLLCSPIDLEALAVGFLFSEGFLKNRNEVKKLTVDRHRGKVIVSTKENTRQASERLGIGLITSGSSRKVAAQSIDITDMTERMRVDSQLRMTARQVSSLVKRFQSKSQVFKATGGVHDAALCNEHDILVFSEDIGRHNAIDKVIGRCILANIPTANHMMITSGRVSSEIVLKVARMGIPILVSKSAPSNLGVRLASDLKITVIGFARGARMNLYTADRRIAPDREEAY